MATPPTAISKVSSVFFSPSMYKESNSSFLQGSVSLNVQGAVATRFGKPFACHVNKKGIVSASLSQSLDEEVGSTGF